MNRTNGAGRNVTMLLGGAAVGILGSRLLPPLFASFAGSQRVRAGGDPFALLIDDHRQITSILDDMVACPPDSQIRRSRLFLMLKRKLAKHALAEEDVVYPMVASASSESAGRKQLYDEHADMKIFLYDIENQLKTGQDWSSTVIPLRDLVKRHIDEEENRVFPELRRRLTETTLPKISGQISREEALIV